MYENQEFIKREFINNEVINVCINRIIPIVIGCFMNKNIILSVIISIIIVVMQKIV